MKAKGIIISVLFFLVSLLQSLPLLAGVSSTLSDKEFIPLRLNIKREFQFDLDGCLYREELYLPVRQLLTFLQIKHADQGDELLIFFPNTKSPSAILRTRGVIRYGSEERTLAPDDLFELEGEVYLLIRHLESLLEITFTIDYHSLNIELASPHSFPVIVNKERKARYKNLSAGAGPVPADISIPGSHYLLNGWVSDWSLHNRFSPSLSSHSLQLGLGGQLLGGDLVLRWIGTTGEESLRGHLHGSWKYPFYTSPYLKQLQAGDLTLHRHLGLGSQSFQGVTVTNQPLAPRRYFSSFTQQGTLLPGWDSELYINHRLSDYALGDDSPTYQFTSPLYYGSNFIELTTYNPSGMLYNHEQHMINIPQDILPAGTSQYTLSAGKLTRSGHHFGYFSLKGGLSSYFTAGAGAAIVNHSHLTTILPVMRAWARVGNTGIIYASHTYHRQTFASLQTMLPGMQRLKMEMTKYHHHSEGNPTGKAFETSFNTSLPLTLPSFRIFPFLYVRGLQFRSGYQMASIRNGFSSRLPLGIQWRMNHRLTISGRSGSAAGINQLELETKLSKRIFYNVLLQSGFRYNYLLDQVTDFQFQLSKRVLVASHLELKFMQNNLLRDHHILLSARLDLPFARNTTAYRSTGREFYTYHQTSGSILFDQQQDMVDFSGQRRAGRAGILVKAYLDLNDNLRWEPGEPWVEEVKADLYRTGGSTAFHSNRQMFENLMPYEQYLIKINPSTISNPLWVSKHSSFLLQAQPNLITTLNVPLIITGEVAGNLQVSGPTYQSLNGLAINLYTKDGKFIQRILTHGGGYFYYIGLKPGSYTAAIDRDQLQERNLLVLQSEIPFTIDSDINGDITEGLLFQLESLKR